MRFTPTIPYAFLIFCLIGSFLVMSYHYIYIAMALEIYIAMAFEVEVTKLFVVLIFKNVLLNFVTNLLIYWFFLH